MLENRNQLRNIISNVLNRSGFYYLPFVKLAQVLKLLEMQQSSDPNTILEQVHVGIIRLYQKFKQKIASHIFSEKFSQVSKDMKDLLFGIFSHLHQQIMTKQQTMVHSMQMNPYSPGMYYPQIPNSGYNVDESSTNVYPEEMKKYYQTGKAHSYYFLNSQMNNPLNLAMHQPMNDSVGSQLNMPMAVPNSYLNYGGSPTMNLPYSQMRPVPKTHPNGIPYPSMNPYMAFPGVSTMCPSQYMGSYQPNLMGAYGQTSSLPFSLPMGYDKTDLITRNSQMSSSNRSNQLDKKYLALQNNIGLPRNLVFQSNKYQEFPKYDKQKILSKQPKPFPLNRKTALNPLLSQNLIKNDETKVNDYLPKKLPHNDTKRLTQPNQTFKSCACKGYFQYQTSFNCSVCKNKFHFRCLGIPQKQQQLPLSQISCAHCRMKYMDPLNKVQKAAGQFYLMNLSEKSFQSVINFKQFQQYFRQKNSKYELQIRCIRSGEHMKNLQITWPDQCQIKINGQKIIQIPALQSNSSLKKRKDYSVFITQNIYSRAAIINPQILSLLQRVRFSLQLKTLSVQQANGKKMRNQFTFALGIYLVYKLSQDELFTKVMTEDKTQNKDFLKNLMKKTQNQFQINKITIKLLDPFSWDMIRTPVRGHECTHAQCFDLRTFISLMYSARNRTWKCPLCLKDSRTFILDHEQIDLLKKAHLLTPVPKQVSIFKQGKIAFKVEKDSDDEEEVVPSSRKTKKIVKQKKQEVPKQK